MQCKALPLKCCDGEGLRDRVVVSVVVVRCGRDVCRQSLSSKRWHQNGHTRAGTAAIWLHQGTHIDRLVKPADRSNLLAVPRYFISDTKPTYTHAHIHKKWAPKTSEPRHCRSTPKGSVLSDSDRKTGGSGAGRMTDCGRIRAWLASVGARLDPLWLLHWHAGL